MVLPLFVYIQALSLNKTPDIDISSYLSRIEKNTFYLIIMGIILAILIVIFYIQKPISVYKLIISGIMGVLYIIYIFIAANSEILEISTEQVYLRIDLSILNLLLLPIPFLSMVRTSLNFLYVKRDLICKLLIIELILLNKDNSRLKLRKSILKKREIDQKLKRYLLKNFKEIIESLEVHQPYPLIMKEKNGYRVTSSGHELLERYGYKDSYREVQLTNLQVWTEAELKQFAIKRSKKNKKKK